MSCHARINPALTIEGPDDFFAPVEAEFALGDNVVYHNQHGVILARSFGHRHGTCDDTRYDVRVDGITHANVNQCDLTAAP